MTKSNTGTATEEHSFACFFFQIFSVLIHYLCVFTPDLSGDASHLCFPVAKSRHLKCVHLGPNAWLVKQNTCLRMGLYWKNVNVNNGWYGPTSITYADVFGPWTRSCSGHALPVEAWLTAPNLGLSSAHSWISRLLDEWHFAQLSVLHQQFLFLLFCRSSYPYYWVV